MLYCVFVASDDEAPPRQWPELPLGCPPNDAVERAGTFYRLVNDVPRDWQTPHMFGGRSRPPQYTQCEWQSLSAFTTLADAVALRANVPGFRRHRIISFTMTQTMGLLQGRPEDSHYNWWPYEAFIPPPDFTEAESVSGNG